MSAPTCSVDGCDRPRKSPLQIHCETHYRRVRLTGEPGGPIATRKSPRPLMDHVQKTDTCWTWTGPLDRNGYGKYGGYSAHRRVYRELVGPIGEGLEIDHLCRNRACVNPAHLEPVTRTENIRRSYAVIPKRPWDPSLLRTHCIRGHEFTPENTYTPPSATGRRRECRACLRIRHALRRDARRAASETAASTPPFDRLAAARDQPEPVDRDVRVWAARAGIDCQRHGRVPQRVRAAYLGAHR